MPPMHRTAFVATLAGLLAACAVAPVAAPPVVGTQATLEGSVGSVDTAPWAYDGNAVVIVRTATQGDVAVNLPARWNLCKAAPVDDVPGLATGQRVRVTGSVTAPGVLTLCERPEHRLVRLP